MEWEKRYEELLLTDEELNELNVLVDKVITRCGADNPLEFAFLAEQFARLSGFTVAQAELEAKVKYATKIAEEASKTPEE